MKTCACVLFLCLIGTRVSEAEYRFRTFEYPGSLHTFANSIHGNVIVGAYSNVANIYPYHGFIYDGSHFTTLDFPGAVSTVVSDFDGNRFVGHYDVSGRRHGFTYENGAFTTIDHPLTNPNSFNGSEALGVSGDNIVGVYLNTSGNTRGYVFDGTAFSTLSFPGAGITTATGVDGNIVVGSYFAGGRSHGYRYDGIAFQTIDPPNTTHTTSLDIDGNNVVGYYADASNSVHGYVFDGTSYTIVDVPATMGRQTIVNGIYGNVLVGQFIDRNGRHHGFVSVPEPSLGTLCFAAFAELCFRRRRKDRRFTAGR